MTTCPWCEGRGFLRVLLGAKGGHCIYRNNPCYQCSAEARPRRIHTLRQERLKRGLTLQGAAAERGMGLDEYNRLEQSEEVSRP